MSVTATVNKTHQAAGLTFAENRTITADAHLAQDASLPAAKAGTLSTRTDNTSGTATLASGHGVTTAARVDLYWAGGARRGVTVGTVAGTSVPFSGGAGDNLPVQATAIVVAPTVEMAVVLTGDKLRLLALLTASTRSQFTFAESDNDEIATFKVGTGGVPTDLGHVHQWDYLNGVTNPLAAGAIAKCFVSHDDTTNARKVNLAALYMN